MKNFTKLKELLPDICGRHKQNRKKYDSRARSLLIGILISIALGYMFFGSIIGIICLLPYSVYFAKQRVSRLKAEREWGVTDHFCEALKSLASALEAGYSVENAVSVVVRELTPLYTADDEVVREMSYMQRQIANSVNAERAFAEFAERLGIEDARNFADVFRTAKRTGGDIISIINQTSSVIWMKHEVRREIRTVTAAKRLETRVMKVMPFAILAYLRIFSAEMCASLYSGVGSRVFMAVVLVIYFFGCRLADRIADIHM